MTTERRKRMLERYQEELVELNRMASDLDRYIECRKQVVALMLAKRYAHETLNDWMHRRYLNG